MLKIQSSKVASIALQENVSNQCNLQNPENMHGFYRGKLHNFQNWFENVFLEYVMGQSDLITIKMEFSKV